MHILHKEKGTTEHYSDIHIYAECVRVVYQNRIPSLLSVLIVSVIPLVVGLHEKTRTVVLILVSILWGYLFLNSFLCIRFNRSKISDQDTVKWGIHFYIQHCLLALLLDSIFLYLQINRVEGSLLYLIMVSLGFSAGSVSAFHQLKWAPPIFITSSMIPQIIYFLSLQSKSNIVVAAMLTITIIFMSIISMKQHKNWIRTLALSFELQVAKNEAERIARIDILTGIYNRRAFYEMAPKYIAAAKRSNRPLSVVMLDIDHFKSINDTYGHAVGDIVLVSIANMIKHEIRESDIVGRLGGEEFVILLPDSDRDGAFKIVERLRQKVQSMNFPGYDFNVTSSFGIVLNTAHESIDRLLKNADSALYDAKNRGRNQTIVYEQPGID